MLYGKPAHAWKDENKNKEELTVEKDLFKIEHNTAEGQWAILIERGLKREPIITSVPRREFRLKGFLKTTNASYYQRNSSPTGDELFNMQSMFQTMCNLLNAYHRTDLLIEDQYDKVLEAFEPFIDEALEFEEFESMMEVTTIAQGKKKKIFRKRGRI